ncbi:MAG: SDR family oxidoreductase [Sandaracinaceae bacterium]|nr:SDR family oxidoreductase [Sandaracinaceae bacterium]
MSSLRSLVTGGAGFVGSHLVDRLLAGGHEVVVVDNFYTGTRANLAHAADRITLVEHDVGKPWPELGRFDRIYNLACPASPPHYQRDPIFTTLTCVNGALHALELARACGARMLQASTSEVYGDPRVHPQPESYRGVVNPVGPRACYDEGKRVAETLCADYRRQHGADARIARIFNTYGPRMDPSDGRVVSNLLVQALRGEALTLYGDGTQTRSFCYVDDLVEGLVRLMEHPSEAGPINLGNDGEMTLLELAERVRELTGRRSELVFRPLPVDDPVRRQPDLTLARARLGYAPRVTLADGLARTAAYFETRAVREPARSVL